MNKSKWEIPFADDALLCEREVGNAHDTYAVAIRKDIAGKRNGTLDSVKYLFYEMAQKHFHLRFIALEMYSK